MPTANQSGLDARLGLNIPYEWWPSAPALKALEAAGFTWVQVAAPPVAMLADPRHAVRHSRALRRALEVTSLRIVVHGPTNLQLGSALHGPGNREPCSSFSAIQGVWHPPVDDTARS